MSTNRPSLRLIVLLVVALLWPAAPPAPAAPAEGIAVLFPGSLTGGSSTAPGPADDLFASLAAAATSSIDVALYDFDRAPVRDALVAARQRGLTVRVVGDNEAAADPQDSAFYASLSNAGIPVVTDTKSSIMHNKFAVFDGQVTWTGSANFTDTAFTRNAENIVVITDTVVADIYTTEFNEMVAGKFSNDKADNTGHNATVGSAAVEVAFAPTDAVEQRIVSAIQSADVAVQVAMFAFTNPVIAQALIAAHQRGAAVEVLLDSTADGSQFSQRDPLCAAGVSVRVETWPGLLHDKYAVIDAGTGSDPLIITGSTNWTGNGVDANDENVLIVHDGALVSTFVADFARLRGAIAPGGFVCNTGGASVYLPLVLQTGASPPPGATITDIVYDPPETLSEYVVIANEGGAALDLTNWTLSDLASNTYTFPSFTLAAGATVKVWTTSGTNDRANLYWGRAQTVWNNSGDTAILRNAQGAEMSRYSYP